MLFHGIHAPLIYLITGVGAEFASALPAALLAITVATIVRPASAETRT